VLKKTDISGSPVNYRHGKVRVAGDVLEVRRYLHLNDGMAIQKLNEFEYVVKATGEILPFKKIANRSEARYQMSETFGNMRAIINANFKGGLGQCLITLTYRENMTDTERLHNDFKKFRQKLERRTKCKLSYLAAVEPQGRGAWHLHALYKRADGGDLYIPQKELLEVWGHGGVNVKRLKDVDNVGAYLSAYLMNMSTEENETAGDGSETETGQTDKKYAKGERLKLYPPGMNFYRCSRDLVRPEWKSLDELSVKEKAVIRNGTPDYSRAQMIQDDDQILQIVEYSQYNTARKKPKTSTTSNFGN